LRTPHRCRARFRPKAAGNQPIIELAAAGLTRHVSHVYNCRWDTLRGLHGRARCAEELISQAVHARCRIIHSSKLPLPHGRARS
jgi:hypothetical protein